ncbi:MAG: c-type cytochrome [Burkholderiales bacterium]
MKTGMLVAALVALTGALGTAHAADASAGKAKAAACAGCHVANGEGVSPNPALASMPQAKFVQAMKDYKSGKRANPVMKNFAAPLDDKDIANLGEYYASLKKK